MAIDNGHFNNGSKVNYLPCQSVSFLSTSTSSTGWEAPCSIKQQDQLLACKATWYNQSLLDIQTNVDHLQDATQHRHCAMSSCTTGKELLISFDTRDPNKPSICRRTAIWLVLNRTPYIPWLNMWLLWTHHLMVSKRLPSVRIANSQGLHAP